MTLYSGPTPNGHSASAIIASRPEVGLDNKTVRSNLLCSAVSLLTHLLHTVEVMPMATRESPITLMATAAQPHTTMFRNGRCEHASRTRRYSVRVIFDPDIGGSNIVWTYFGRELHWHKTSEVSLPVGVSERTALTQGIFAQWAYVIKVLHHSHLLLRLYLERCNIGIYSNLRGGPGRQKLSSHCGKECWSDPSTMTS